jgi:hypothetical protein
LSVHRKVLRFNAFTVIDDGHRFVANKHHPLDIAVAQRRLILLTQRKLTCVNIEALSGAPQFPTWG